MFVSTERNTAPIANAGGDQTFTMPVNAILLNGTKSSDDLRVTNFTWERDGSSLAIGTIIGESNKEPVLVVCASIFTLRSFGDYQFMIL